ncbi:S41 family peptidase [Flavitalea sp.]|nr:S41 family peptidase [Flavitalea sp.]
MQIFKSSLFAVCVAGIVLMSSCKKETSSDEQPPVDSTGNGSVNDKIKDTVLGYSQDIYLWFEQIPSTFKPRTYADPNKIMTAIREYSVEPGFTKPVDRWSFAMKKAEWDDLSSGIAGDFGIDVVFRAEGDLRVKSVEKKSPAGKAGVRRGWRITKLNGSSNITTTNSNAIVDAVFYSNSTVFEFQKPDGTSTTSTLAATSYQQNPIFLDTVYTAGANKVGYLVFNSFLGDSNQIYNSFQQIFGRFVSENVKDVIVDLRYNGGGYVSMQEKLANYLVKPAATGQLMMKEVFNKNYIKWNESINFSKLGSLNPSRVFFIVSDNTASASELLINNLKPYVEVKLVGPKPTYGKPVGYFPIGVGDWYIFPVSFRSTNKDGQGNYFDGIALDSKSADGVDKDWGNIQEASLANVLSYIASGNFVPLSTTSTLGISAEVSSKNKLFSDRSFKGAVISQRPIKP